MHCGVCLVVVAAGVCGDGCGDGVYVCVCACGDCVCVRVVMECGDGVW
jgi:hypothetical protein